MHKKKKEGESFLLHSIETRLEAGFFVGRLFIRPYYQYY